MDITVGFTLVLRLVRSRSTSRRRDNAARCSRARRSTISTLSTPISCAEPATPTAIHLAKTTTKVLGNQDRARIYGVVELGDGRKYQTTASFG
jgi:hypothetical protein